MFVADSALESITESTTFDMVWNGSNIDDYNCGEVVSESMQNHDFGSENSTMPLHLMYVDCENVDGEVLCEHGFIDVQTNADGNDELWNMVWVDEDSECDGGFNNTTNMCSEYIGLVLLSDNIAFMITHEDEDALFYYQYDESTGSGLIMQVTGDDDHDSDGPMMVCYDMNTHEVDMSIESESDCEAAGLMWTEMRDDDHSGDHDDGTLYISIGEAMLPFEGDMSDYTIELATCESDYNMETGEETKECTAQMTVSMTDAMLAGSSVMFHDADSSGTISDGDMIHVSETVDVEWSEVRLYSSSADAYSDENPVFEVPGFTGVVGVLALLGAALLRRKA